MRVTCTLANLTLILFMVSQAAAIGDYDFATYCLHITRRAGGGCGRFRSCCTKSCDLVPTSSLYNLTVQCCDADATGGPQACERKCLCSKQINLATVPTRRPNPSTEISTSSTQPATTTSTTTTQSPIEHPDDKMLLLVTSATEPPPKRAIVPGKVIPKMITAPPPLPTHPNLNEGLQEENGTEAKTKAEKSGKYTTVIILATAIPSCLLGILLVAVLVWRMKQQSRTGKLYLRRKGHILI